MLHGSMVRLWSYPDRTISPWLMSLVHAVPLYVTLLDLANGLASVAAGAVNKPLMAVVVQDRKYRRPSEPIASTSSRYCCAPETWYTLLASNSLNFESDSATTGALIPLGKFASDVCERYRWPLSSEEKR